MATDEPDDLDAVDLADEAASQDAAAAKVARYLARPRASEVQAETARASSRAGRGFKCPKCHCTNFRVLETRSGEDSKSRRRECRCCGYRFTTLKVPVS
jgi:DNA-directed RNA polymerase subunit M/transcription elongation factor TFIIS